MGFLPLPLSLLALGKLFLALEYLILLHSKLAVYRLCHLSTQLSDLDRRPLFSEFSPSR